MNKDIGQGHGDIGTRTRTGTGTETRTLQEVSLLCGVSLKTVQRWKRQGKFPGATKEKNRVRIPQADIDALLAARQGQGQGHKDIGQGQGTLSGVPDDPVTPESPPVTPDDPIIPDSLPTPQPTQALDYRHRLQISWPRLGIYYEYKQPIDEPGLIRAGLRWIADKIRIWLAGPDTRSERDVSEPPP